MPLATLLLREPATSSLTSIVEKSQLQKPPLPEFDLRLTSCQLDIVLTSKPDAFQKFPDEGFESDIDSIVSSDDSFKNQETDSANGSATDSDTDAAPAPQPSPNETFNLVDCLCYTDVKFPNLLLFVIKSEVLVFKFGNLEVLKCFYANFSSIKAVTNQKTYGKQLGAKFNLLQRTDSNGITHIEIKREPETRVVVRDNYSAPATLGRHLNTLPTRGAKIKDRPRQRDKSDKSASTEDILELVKTAQKTWGSAENLLDGPSRPERRRKPKGKAPPPPIPTQNVLRGPYVRVNVLAPLPVAVEPKTFWASSVPRFLKKPRSRSESRNFTPMAYRYIDATQPNPFPERLFGMSSKLKEFDPGRGRLAEVNCRDGSLKSVIKKDESRKRNDKKVTFSAYNTIQVV